MPQAAAPDTDNYDVFQLDWDAIDHDQLYVLSVHDEQLTTMASNLAGWLADGEDLICLDEDGSNSPDVEGEDFDPELLQPGATHLAQCGDTTPPNATWFPWPDKKTCILNILRHLPRSLFSDVQLQVILWGLSVLGVDNIPSTRILKDIDSALQSQYGIPSVCYQGALGHIYYVNHLPSIIAQSLFLSIGTPNRLLQVPLPLTSSNGVACGKLTLFQFLLLFPHLLQTYQMDGQPDPRNIIGLIEMRGCGVLPWTLTNPAVSNRWCMLAWGHHVLSYMIWLYCDNTSGNTSKKWNKHNSFLFTAARLPHVMVHKESSIHFLATSNIAPPLEMLDGIVDQLEYAQMHGVWAWDIEAREMALVIPAILVMLGNNLMQSELACHGQIRVNTQISQA
ncbi:hypothetical protein EDC04DRAFT_2613469 [Pisolithus marmoratus]|nr:hypothetical protein EDC04DRAFT_2613469 [Pisolithus marmoratus]